MSHWSEYTKLLAGLIAISNPLGAIPVYLSLTAKLSLDARKHVALTTAIAISVTLIFFSLVGEEMLAFFGITIDAFRIAGGLLLLIMALKMMGVSGESDSTPTATDSAAVGIVPMAIPLMAGPGAISTVILYAEQGDSFQHTLLVTGVILTVAIVSFIVLRIGLRESRFLTPTASKVFDRIMGLIIAAISVEFILDGIAGHFPGLLQ